MRSISSGFTHLTWIFFYQGSGKEFVLFILFYLNTTVLFLVTLHTIRKKCKFLIRCDIFILGSGFGGSSFGGGSFGGGSFGGGGQTVVQKHIYVHVPPPEPEEVRVQRPIQAPVNQKHYKIIFIKVCLGFFFCLFEVFDLKNN